MDEIREKFGDKVNVDAMFDEFGLDSKELSNLNTDYKSKLTEANKIKELHSQKIKFRVFKNRSCEHKWI